MSWITRSTPWRASALRPSAGEAAVSTRAPCSDSSTSKAVRTPSLSSITSTVRLARLACNEPGESWFMAVMLAPPRLLRPRCCPPDAAARAASHTVRVATDGDTAEARRAGCQAASWPTAHSTSTPPTR